MQNRMEFSSLGMMSSLIRDYIAKKPELNQFISAFPSFDSAVEAARKRSDFPSPRRKKLVEILRDQYSEMQNTENALRLIDRLEKSHAVTVTTGHQLCFATGPLYFIYKILNTIKACDNLNSHQKEFDFIPVFWMATEDHDFAEINHFHLFHDKFHWETTSRGAVGRMDPTAILKLFPEIREKLGEREVTEKIMSWLENYNRSNLSEATRDLVHALFQDRDLLILDADDPILKAEFAAVMEAELFDQESHKMVNDSITELNKLGYDGQATPREINLFYLEENNRDRIIRNGSGFETANGSFKWSDDEMRRELYAHPENFSPNVILRPLYQEYILPNTIYTGGGGEIAYWLQLKRMFDHYNVPFPIVLVRNSVLLIDDRSRDKMNDLGVRIEDLFGDIEAFISMWIGEKAEIDLGKEKEEISKLFEGIRKEAMDIDPTMEKAVLGEEQRQINALENLEKKLIKAAKRREETDVNQIRKLKDRVFPDGALQERRSNIIEIWRNHGLDFMDKAYENFDPFDPVMNIIVP